MRKNLFYFLISILVFTTVSAADGRFIHRNSANNMYYFSGNVGTDGQMAWKQIDGAAKDVALTADGQMICVGTDDAIWYSSGVDANGKANWKKQNGTAATHVAASGNNFMHRNSVNNMYVFSGKADENGQMAWKQIDGAAKSIAIASDGQMMCVGMDNAIWYSSGVDTNGKANWKRQNGTAATHVAIGGSNKFLHRNSANNMYYFAGDADANGQVTWKQIDGAAKNIALMGDGQMMCVGMDDAIYYSSGLDANGKPNWKRQNGTAATHVAAAGTSSELGLMPTTENATVIEDAKIIPNISYGDVVRLTTYPGEKIEDGITLHSHRINYNATTSKKTAGQQQVTGYKGEDNNDWWIVASPDNKTGIVKSGDKIALVHLTTKKCLHTHTDANLVTTNGHDINFTAPDNEHREVTCYNLDKTQPGNIWIIKIYDGKAPTAAGSNWMANKNVVLERYNPHLGNPDYKTNYPEYLWISDKTFSPDGNPQSLQHIVGLNKIPTYFVVEDIKNKPNYIYGKFVVDVPLNLPTKWFAEDGKFSMIAVGSTSKGEILKYAIDMDGNLYEFNNDSMSDNPWEKVEEINDTAKQPIGKLINLTTSADGNILVINAENKVFRFDFVKKVWTEIKNANQPKLTQISCGNDKTIVAKSAENKLYKLGSKEWEEISDEGEMVVATVKSNIFGLGLNGNVYKHTTGEEWNELATATTPFVYIAAADTLELKVKTTDAAKKSATKSTTKTDTKSKTTKATTETVEKTVIFAIDKDFALWKLVLGETKWTPILGKDGKQATGFSKIATNGASHVALDGENDNYHFGESGIKIAADKTAVVVTPVKATRTQAIQTGKIAPKAAAKVAAKKSVKAKATVKKATSKTKLTKSKKAKKKATVKAKKKAVKKATTKTAKKGTAAKKSAAKTVATPATTTPVTSTATATPAA